MQIGVIGVGAVGLSWASELRQSGYASVALADPYPSESAKDWASAQGLTIAPDPAAAADSSQIVLACVPGSVLIESVQSVLKTAAADAVIIDLTTADPESKVGAAASAAAAGVRYVDAAITGAVGLTGARTPLLVAGHRYPDVDALLATIGAPAQYLPNSHPGDAVRVKLLRSVITKGIEALAVEVLPAARDFGLLDQLFTAMGDIDKRPFTDLLMAMVSSHPAQAGRRHAETLSAAEQLENGGHHATLTRQVAGTYADTAAHVAEAGLPARPAFTETLDWLDEGRHHDATTAKDVQEVRA